MWIYLGTRMLLDGGWAGGGYQEVRTLRTKMKLVDNSIDGWTEREIDTDVDRWHVGMMLRGNRERGGRYDLGLSYQSSGVGNMERRAISI